jgi:hypothetical protein
MQRLYHIIAVNDKTGHTVYLTGYPMPHKKCMTMKGKISYHPARTIQIVEAKQ